MRKFRGRGLLVTFVVIGLLVMLYAAAGYFWAPRLIESQLVALVEQRLGQTLSIEKIRVNPFALSVDAAGLRLAQGDKPPLVSAGRVSLNLSLWGSGFGRGWVLSEARSEGLQVMLETDRDGHLNFATLAQRWKQTSQPSTGDSAPPRVTVRHLVASDGMLSYRELSEEPAATRILPIRIELEDVSTLPDREGQYSVFARFADGGVLTWRGDLTLQPLQSEGDLDLRGLKLATAWQFLRDELTLAEPDGQLDLAAHYKFDRGSGKPRLALSALRAEVVDLSVAREDASGAMLALKSVVLRDGSFRLDQRTFDVGAVTLSTGHLSVLTHADGALNWAGLVRRPSEPSGNASAEPARSDPGRPNSTGETSPWRIGVREVSVDNVALRYTDRQRPLDVQVGRLDGAAAVDVTVGQKVNVVTRDMDLAVQTVRMGADAPPVQLRQVHLQSGYFDLDQRRFGAGQLLVDGGTVRLERGANGALSITEPFTNQGFTNQGDGSTASTRSWRYALDRLRVKSLDVAVSDLSFGPPIAIPVVGISLRLEHIASAAKKPMDLNASATIGRAGSVEARGTVAQNFARMDATVNLQGIALTPLQPLITRYVAVDLASGSAAADVTLSYRQAGKPAFAAKGKLALSGVRLNEAASKTRVLAWKNLSTTDARLTLQPNGLDIKEIILDAPEMTVDISEQRQVNLVQLFKPPGTGQDKPADARTRTPDKAGARTPATFPIRVGDLRVRDGIVDYSDRSLVLPFATHVTNFDGVMAGFGTGKDQVATLQFDGDIGDFGSAEVTGRINAFSPSTLTDIAASFQNVEMPELSPYTATFLGRKVAAGKLWVDVSYRVNDGALTGNNDVTIRELKLGEKIKAPSALDLPLDLAVALLTDSEGVIHTAVPVNGNLKDPKFDLSAVIREALGNVIQKIVTAPFRALAGLFKGGKDGGGKNGTSASDVGSIEFQPGSAKVAASEKEKLQNVAKAMEERPRLKLVVQAPYAPEADRAAMKRERAHRDLAQALGRSLKADEKAAPLPFDNVDTQRALENLATRLTDASAVDAWVERYTRKNGEPKRAGTFLRRPGDPKFYEAMFNWIAGIESVPDSAMQKLAENRAENVMQTLRDAGIDPARIATESAEARKVGDGKSIAAELSLAPAQPKSAVADADALTADAEN